MTLFVENGPDIPEKFLHAHENGKVIFFCGAGVSYPSGLPDFKELVQNTSESLRITDDPLVKAAIGSKEYDTAIGLLEKKTAGGSEKVRTIIMQILSLSDNATTATHEALLTLARNREGKTRLITTNFDRLFEEVIKEKQLAVKRFKAPSLPIPKRNWDGLVYLHGLLPLQATKNELNDLVLSSGDFGLAYLIDRWAARFISAIFQKYTVCFIGYSINDSVLRYMMDALAADRSLGETPPEMFVFGDYSKKDEQKVGKEWTAKNVIPILYKKYSKHAHLHKTLHKWAETYRDGINGKKRIVDQYARFSPSGIETNQVLWALTTDVLAAKHFANMNPVPPFEWLDPLKEAKFGYSDLPRFGIATDRELSAEDKKIRFSILQRPASYTKPPWMCVTATRTHETNWDETMEHLAWWLTRHLNNSELILWLTGQVEQPDRQFSNLIQQRIGEIQKLESEGKKKELNEIRVNAPHAIPSPLMRKLWEVFLAKRVISNFRIPSSTDWRQRLNTHGITPFLRMELREALTPYVQISKLIDWMGNKPETAEPQHIRELVECKFVLYDDDVRYELPELENNPQWQKALPELLPDFTALLHETLDLMRELGYATEKHDDSLFEQPSISQHSQNLRHHSWTILIELSRDAWLATAKQNPAEAKRVAESWWHMPYPAFKRLALFAVAQPNMIDDNQTMNWLGQEKCWWLWAIETKREVIRLLVVIAPQLTQENKAKLASAILAGPPRKMYRDDIEDDKWTYIVERNIWLRLAKIHTTGASLGNPAKKKLDGLTQKYPKWKIAEDEKDEFQIWTESGGDGREFKPTPRRRKDLIEWIRAYKPSHSETNDWRSRCSESFLTPAYTLCVVAKEGSWQRELWREALQAWSEEKYTEISWRHIAPTLKEAPDEFITANLHGISWWLNAVAKTLKEHEDIFFILCKRILSDGHETPSGMNIDDPLTVAINHPVGLVVGALLNWWHLTSPKAGQGLHAKLKPIFTKICDTKIRNFCHGRSVLIRRSIALYSIDQQWTIEHLVPLFDWQSSATEARSAWVSFLYAPSLYIPLLQSIKDPLLDTAKYYQQLGDDLSMQYAQFLTCAALNKVDGFTTDEFAVAVKKLPEEGLAHVAQTLARDLESAEEQRSEYWKNRIVPFLQDVWPNDPNKITPAISSNLGGLCVAAGEHFPEAWDRLRHWLKPMEYPYHVIQDLHSDELCKNFPEVSLCFLDALVGPDTYLSPNELRQCLDDIKESGQLSEDPKFTRLERLLQENAT